MPLLPPPGDDGLTVQVDTPGPHKLTLNVKVLVTPRGTRAANAASSWACRPRHHDHRLSRRS